MVTMFDPACISISLTTLLIFLPPMSYNPIETLELVVKRTLTEVLELNGFGYAGSISMNSWGEVEYSSLTVMASEMSNIPKPAASRR